MDSFILKRFGYASEEDFKEDMQKLNDPDQKGNVGALCLRYGFSSKEDLKTELEDGDNKLNGLNLSFGFEQVTDLAKDIDVTVPETPKEEAGSPEEESPAPEVSPSGPNATEQSPSDNGDDEDDTE